MNIPKWFRGSPPLAADNDDVELPGATGETTVLTADGRAMLVACQAAGITDPGQITTLKADADAYRQMRTARRDGIKAVAVTAYGAGTDALNAAVEDVEATADGPAFDRLCARITADAEKASPAAGAQAQTKPTQNASVANATDVGGPAASAKVMTIAEYNALHP